MNVTMNWAAGRVWGLRVRKGHQMLIDSHAHLDMEEFEGDLSLVLDRAVKGGVTHIITIGVDLHTSRKALELAHRHDFIFSSIGYHPHNSSDFEPDQLTVLNELAYEPKVVAWGEIGLDLFKRYSPPEIQVEAFECQMDMALGLDLPIIIHDREAHKEILEIIRKQGARRQKGVIHCFSGDFEIAMAFIDMGYYISIPGTVTYKNALQIKDVASRIPLDRMLIETDAPYLAPVPKRGKRNEPFFVTHTARKIAELRNMDFDELARRTSQNAIKLFGLPDLRP